MEFAVQQVISEMWERYFEPVNLGELASSVFVSPFHFSRIFARTTGVTPGRYLSAIRMFEAKNLLLTTSLRVSDIVCRVGYSSVGTFTSRFTRMVGMTPSQYREPDVGELLIAVGPGLARVPSVAAVRGADAPTVPDRRPGGGSIVGTVELPPEAAPATIFVCVFREPAPQCAPVAHELLAGSGSSRVAIRDVPPGRCTVIAVAESQADNGGPVLLGAQRRPVLVTPGAATPVRLRLRRPSLTDPPLAISLSDRVAHTANRTTAATAHREWGTAA